MAKAATREIEPTNDRDDYDPETGTDEERDKYVELVRKDFKLDLIAHDNYIQNFDAYEAMLISRPYDSVSKKVGTGLSDGRTTTIYQERSARVAGQLPEGNMTAAGKKDQGAAIALDIIRQKYLYPNANAQAPFLEKIRQWQFYSSVYGFMPMYYDWVDNKRMSADGYVGPDCWLWHPRNFVPQLGRASVEDMDYVHAITYASEEYLEALLDEDDDAGWDFEEVNNLLDTVRDKTRDVDSQRDSLVTRERQSQAERGRIMLATRYEAGKDGNWVVFAPEYNGIVIRTIANPHENGRIPFVVKYATPLFDNFYGLGDFQRAKPLQFASDGLDNFYFAGIKRGLYPPTIINPAGVVKSSITQDPGAIWQETVQNSIREYKTQPVGLSTYQAAKTVMSGALLNQAGTTDTTQTQSNTSDPGFGKTPEAIDNLKQRESTRDNQDRFYLESRLEILIDRMMGLFGTIGTEDIPVDLFVEDFKDISDAGWGDDLKDMLDISDSGQSAHMTVKPAIFKDLTTRFHLEAGSTALADKGAKLKSLETFIQSMTAMQNEMVEMKNQGMTIDWVLVSKIEAELSDVPQISKIFRKMTPEEQQMYQQQQDAANKSQDNTKIIDTTAFDKLPNWAKTQWLERQGFKVPPGADVTTTDQQLKEHEVAAKIHTAAHNSIPPEPTPPADPLAGQSTPVVHNGRIIKDPVLAQTHVKLTEMVHGKQAQQ